MKKLYAGSVAKYILLALATVAFIFPLIWLLYNSFKTNSQLYDNPWALPPGWSFTNYVYAWNTANIGLNFFNSVKVCALSLFFSLLMSTTASFALTRLKWKLSGLVHGLFVVGMMVPIISMLIPLFFMFSRVGLVNTHAALILIYAVSNLPISIFILTGFMRSFPAELEESAVIDGASMGRLFFSITLPVAKSAIATVTIYIFVTMWNELTTAMVFLSDIKLMTIPLALKTFQGQYSTDYVSSFAAVAMATLPTVLIFTLFNRQIMEGVTAGAVKG
uniref:Putative ATPbinding transport protein n=1 Tax=termite gut metagenome TaxID=433724 RepID=S0DFG2_9ZZZZ